MIPGGNIWSAGTITSNGQTSFQIDKVNVKSGTKVLFAISDAGQYGTGGR
jgi:hypothetical protein